MLQPCKTIVSDYHNPRKPHSSVLLWVIVSWESYIGNNNHLLMYNFLTTFLDTLGNNFPYNVFESCPSLLEVVQKKFCWSIFSFFIFYSYKHLCTAVKKGVENPEFLVWPPHHQTWSKYECFWNSVHTYIYRGVP